MAFSSRSLMGTGGGGTTTSVIKKPPVLPKPAIKVTTPPPPASYYNNYKAITTKAATTVSKPAPTKPVSGPSPYNGQKLTPITSTPAKSTSSASGSGGGGSYSGGSSSSVPSAAAPAVASAPAYDPMKDPAYLASMAKLNDLWNQASGYKTQIDDMMKTGFTYDPNTDASYQSLEALAQKNAKTASAGAMEDMNDRGILNSTVTSDRLGQIQQTAQDAVTAQVPNLQNAAYGKYMDKLSQLNNMWNSTVGQAQNERAFGESTKQWNLGYNLDLQKFNTDNAHWQQQFDYGKAQDSINNAFKGQQLNIDQMQYTLQALKQQQDMMGVNNTQATQGAISELLGAKNADDALNIMTQKAQQYYEGGVNFTQLMNALDKRWNGFSSKASSKTTSFK
jgi:hypothetical protein